MTNGEEIIYRGPKSAEALQRERPRYVTIVTERPRYVTMVTGPAEGEALRYHSYIDRDREVTIVTETKTFRLGYHSDKAVTLP